MDTLSSIIIDSFGLAIIILLFIHTYKRSEYLMTDQRLFLGLLISSYLILLFNIGVWVVDGQDFLSAKFFNYFFTIAFLLMSIVPCILWTLYVDYKIFENIERLKKIVKISIIPVAVCVIMLFVSIKTNWVFYIDENNLNRRGEYSWLFTIIAFSIYLYSFVELIAFRKNSKTEQISSMLIFTVIPILALVIQWIFRGIPILWPIESYALLVIYLNIQNKKLNTDPLTDTYNRRQLEIYLHALFRRSRSSRSLAALMIDIDNFKKINDEFGHIEGDNALMETGDVLMRAIGEDGIVVRYGGDEFVLVLPNKSEDEVDLVKSRIVSDAERVNESGRFKFKLKYSIGTLYKGDLLNITDQKIIEELDERMYHDKRTKKAAENV